MQSLALNTRFYLPAFILFLCLPRTSMGHDVVDHLDPELLTGWSTWLHLTIQWSHLIAFALWLGLTVGTLLLKSEVSLDSLLYGSWILFLLMLATGSYNMEWSAGISETPSLLLLRLLERIPYGATYTIVLAVKLSLYVLIVVVALIVTMLHVGRKVREADLRRFFLFSESTLTIIIALATGIVLFYHEVADLWPTAVHSLGGVAGPEGSRVQTIVDQNLPPPNDFQLLTSSAAWLDIGVRWVHLLGFGLWLGGAAVALVFGPLSPARFLLVAWTALILEVLSGVISMWRWTPFYVSPYIWNLNEFSALTFGRSYTVFMAFKHTLAIVALSVMTIMTIRYMRVRDEFENKSFNLRPFLALNVILALAIAYVTIIVLFLHEGVDHAL